MHYQRYLLACIFFIINFAYLSFSIAATNLVKNSDFANSNCTFSANEYVIHCDFSSITDWNIQAVDNLTFSKLVNATIFSKPLFYLNPYNSSSNIIHLATDYFNTSTAKYVYPEICIKQTILIKPGTYYLQFQLMRGNGSSLVYLSQNITIPTGATTYTGKYQFIATIQTDTSLVPQTTFSFVTPSTDFSLKINKTFTVATLTSQQLSICGSNTYGVIGIRNPAIVIKDKCDTYCQNSTDCPWKKPYYKHPTLAKCVQFCPEGYTIGSKNNCVIVSYCHSTCSSCTVKNDISKCSACSSSLLNYTSTPTSLAPSQCLTALNYPAQLLLTINKKSVIGSLLVGVQYYYGDVFNRTVAATTIGTLLSASTIYTQNVIYLYPFSPNSKITFMLGSLPIHEKIIVRLRLYAQTLAFQEYLYKDINYITLAAQNDINGLRYQLKKSTETVVQYSALHNNVNNFNLTLSVFANQFYQISNIILQDVTFYYEKCSSYCGSNNCPDTKPYYRHPLQKRCVSICPAGYSGQSNFSCKPYQFCSSACQTCSDPSQQWKCLTCSSIVTTPVYQSNHSCLYTNFSFLYSINTNTSIGNSIVKSVTYNTNIKITYSGTILQSFLFTINQLQFSSLKNNTIAFELAQLPMHIKLYLRGRVYTSCTQPQNTTAIITLDNGVTASKTISSNAEDYFQVLTAHSSSNLNFTLSFGTQSQGSCRKMLQDITIYFRKCQQFCGSSYDCPDTKPYYKHPTFLKCVSNCPLGYTQNSTDFSCIPLALCFSTCTLCQQNNNEASCLTCTSTQLQYFDEYEAQTTNPLYCDLKQDGDWEYIFNINADTVVGADYLSKVALKNIDGSSVSDSLKGSDLSEVLYTNSIIEFNLLYEQGVDQIAFYLNLTANYSYLARFHINTQCTSRKPTLNATFNDTTIIKNLTFNQQTIVQIVALKYNTSLLQLSLSISNQLQQCSKYIQDISIYKKRCPSYCDQCIDNGILKQLDSNVCKLDCLAKQYIDDFNYCQQCSQFCIQCSQIASNCTLCGKINDIPYYLYYTVSSSQLLLENVQGSCLLDCPITYYKDQANSLCVLCDNGCLQCFQNPNNCTKCTVFSQIQFYLQTGVGCVTTCLEGFYKHNLQLACKPCDPSCTQCLGPLKQSTSTICLEKCLAGQYSDNTNTICLLCSALCKQCAISSDNCTSCKILNLTQYYLTKSDLSDAYSLGICVQACEIGYFEDSTKYQCSKCDQQCLKCEALSSNCSQCKQISDIKYYLQPNLGCQLACPQGYYQSTETLECMPCDSGCRICTSVQKTQCQSCKVNHQNIIHYLVQNSTICTQTCPDGYYGDQYSLKCLSCSINCKTCAYQLYNCTSCQQSGESALIYLENTKCVAACGTGYYLYNKICLKNCPNNTVETIDSNIKICQQCTSSNNYCQTTQIQLVTLIKNQGKTLQHQISFPNGIHSTILDQDIYNNIKIYLIKNEQSNFVNQRLLLNLKQMKVQFFNVTDNRRKIVIITFNPFKEDNLIVNLDNYHSQMVVQDGFILRDQNYIRYNDNNVHVYSLNDARFVREYYNLFKNEKYLGVGIFICISTLLLLIFGIIIVLKYKSLQQQKHKFYHQFVSTITVIILLGLMRAKLYSYPSIEIFEILKGYSIFQFNYLPNFLSYLFAVDSTNTQKYSIDTIKMAFGNHNLINNLGSSLEIYLIFQLVIVLAYVLKFKHRLRYSKYKCLQDILITILSIKTVYSCCLMFLAIVINDTSTLDMMFLINIFIAGIMLILFVVYLIVWVYPNVQIQFYKITNTFRILTILLMTITEYGAMVALNIVEILSAAIDFHFFKQYKINKTLYIIQRLLILLAFNIAHFVQSPLALMSLLPIILQPTIAIKIYYLLQQLKQIVQHQQQQNQQMKIIVNNEIKQFQEKQNNLNLNYTKHNFIIEQQPHSMLNHFAPTVLNEPITT